MKSKDFFYTLLRVLLGGVILGLIISLFQYLNHIISDRSLELFRDSSVGLFIGIVVISLVYFTGLTYLNRKIPGYTGSGIPQVEAYHAGWYQFNPLIMLGLIFLNSLSAFYAGFLLGGEGPSVTIGASIGMEMNKLTKKEDKELVAALASAAFGCALMAPVAGFFHLIEENKKVLSLSLILKGLVIISISFTICYFLFNHKLFNINVTNSLAGLYYLYIPLFILYAIIMAKVFRLSLLFSKDLFSRFKWLDYLTPIIAVLFMVLRRYVPSFSGSGAKLIAESLLDSSIALIIGIMAWRLFAGGLSLASKVSGGLTLPTLAFGFLSGGFLVALIGLIDPQILEYKGVLMILTMVVLFAVLCDTPIAGLFVGLGMGSLKALALPLTIGVIVYMLLDHFVFKWESIYKSLERRLPGFKEASHGTI